MASAFYSLNFPSGLIQEAISVESHFADPTLRALKESAPALLLASKSPNTMKSYSRGIRKWKTWSSKFSEIPFFPVSATALTLFITSMVQSGERISEITQSFYGISFLHDVTGKKNPCKNKFAKTALVSARKILSKSIKKKEVITPEHLRQLCKSFSKTPDNLMNYRTIAICCVAFAGFLRFNEVANLKRSDISFHETYMKIFIAKSKTDIYREGAHVLIAKTGSTSCPYRVLKKYLELANIPENSNDYVFRAISLVKKQDRYKLRMNNKPISYSRAREIVLDAFSKIGLNKKDFGLHSLRAGGATAAANAGINDRLFKRHGRWKSENAKDGYIKDKLSSLLSVSLSLGL